jgi:hypothetical protein
MTTEGDPMTTDPTPGQARDQLQEVARRPLTRSRDRAVHATATAATGLALGLLGTAQNIASGLAANVALTGFFFAVALGSAAWAEHAARTVPRRARAWSRAGMIASLVLNLVLVRPWLNLQAQTEPNTWSMVLVGAVVVAVPSLAAAAMIARGRR